MKWLPAVGNLETLEVSAGLWQFSGSNKDHVTKAERVDIRAQVKKGLLQLTEGQGTKQNIVICPDHGGDLFQDPLGYQNTWMLKHGTVKQLSMDAEPADAEG